MTACVICDTPKPMFQWTDTHGIGQCTSCGAPHRIYHYDGEGPDSKRIDKEPECVVLPAWVPLLKRYRADTGKIIPGGFSFSPDYELARPDDFEAFKGWCNAHRAEIDAIKQPESAGDTRD